MRLESCIPALGLLAATVASPVHCAQAPKFDVDGTLALRSDYVFRGVSQTMGNAALQAGINAALPGGITLYGWASNLDFTARGDPDDGAEVEVDAGISVESGLGGAGTLEAGLVRYLYPGVARGVDYDYSEWLLAWTFKDRIRADLGYSNDVFASGEPGWAWQLEFTQALPASSSLSVAYGAYQLERVYGTSYGYGEIALRRDIGPWTLGLTYSTTSASARTLFAAEAVGDRLVASVELSVW